MRHSFFCVVLFAATAQALPVKLTTNSLANPIGLDTPKPTFSWMSDAQTPNWRQTAYEVLVDTKQEALNPGQAAVWDSGRMPTQTSVGVVFAGTPLKPQQRYFWRVVTWDKDGKKSLSDPAWFETGLLKAADWKAAWIRRVDPENEKEWSAIRWIGAEAANIPASQTVPVQFRYELRLTEVPIAASLHVAARGDSVVHINGHISGHHNGWGAFDREELVGLLHAGTNQIEVSVKPQQAQRSGPVLAGLLAASIRYTSAEGTETRVVTNDAWQARTNPESPWHQAVEAAPLKDISSAQLASLQAIPHPDRVSTDASLFRKDFDVAARVTSARLTVTALGAYRAYVNGQAVAPETLLSPGFTDFHKRVQYQTYDVTTMLTQGSNALGLMLGGGWYSSPLTWDGIRYTPGPNLLRAQLDVTFANGQHQTIGTDSTWQSAPAPITFSEIYGGESFDARLLQPRWSSPRFAGSHWTAAQEAAPPDSKIIVSAEPDLPIHTAITLQPVKLNPSTSAHPAIYDMGQNMVGNVRLHIRGPRGMVVRLRYAERLNPDGSIYTENLRNADATDTYALFGEGDETWTPAFTFHGFRYVELSYLGAVPSTQPTLKTIEGLVFNSLPSAPSVRFHSSSDTLNKMNELGVWGQRGNFFSIPTDCPQRDERLGWMGDAGAFWRTGSYNFDVDAFTRKFMLDVTDAQRPSGAFTDISPDILGENTGAPGWGDAGILIPYAAWLQYGDIQTVAQSWPAMQRWMDFILSNNPDYIRRKGVGFNFADWLAPDPHTPTELIGTAYWAMVAHQMMEMAQALHRPDDAAKYQEQYKRIAAAYRTAFVKADGSVEGDTQTGYLATLFTGIAPQPLVPKMMERLTQNIEAHGSHLTTGFLGTPFLLFVLDEHGKSDLAFKLLLSETYPSWGYMVKNGATTWWERWNGDTGDPSMNSYNHYAFGSVMAWVYRRAAGIDTDPSGAAFNHITVRPHFSPLLPQLRVEYDSAYGTIVSDWKQDQHRFTITIPANTSATVTLPDGQAAEVGSGTHSYSVR